MHRAILRVGFCLALLALAAGSSLRAQETKRTEAPLPFWEIGLSEFEAADPQPIAVPLPSGTPEYYWTWTFAFRAQPSLERIRRIYAEILPTLSPRKQELLRNDIEALETTLTNALRVPMAVRLVTDKGTIVADTANPTIRNLVEKRRRTRLETVGEIAAREIPRGETVHGVATFPNVPPDAQLLEIQVTGLGHRLTPGYEPGGLRYGDNRRAPTVQRVLRFRYRRIGEAFEPRLVPVQFEGATSDWLWVWTAQVYPGAPREVRIERTIGEDTTLARTYYYMPYRIWNNTYEAQDLTVETAGLRVPVAWRGETIALRLLDDGTDDYWKTLVRREARRRIDSGREADFIRDHEVTTADGSPPARVIESRIPSLDATAPRHVAGTIPPGRMAEGMTILRAGPDELTETVDDLIAQLQLQAVAPSTAEPSGLLEAYRALRPDVPADTPAWKLPPEPSTDTVRARLLALAEEDLAARDLAVSGQDERRWGDLAPLGVLFQDLAEEALRAQLAEGVVEVSFTVARGEVTETSSFPAHLRRALPEEWQPVRPDEADLAGLE